MKRLLFLAALLCAVSLSSEAKKKKTVKNNPLLSTVKKDSVGAEVQKIKKDATMKKGLFTVYFNEKTGKLHFQIPDSALSKTYMLASRISSTSDGQDYVAGQMNIQPMLITFSTDGRNVYMHQIQNLKTVSETDPIASAFKKNNLNPILKGFKVAAKDSSSVFIDVTNFFGTNEKSISPIKDSDPVSKLLGGSNGLKGTFSADASGISMVKAFEKNIEIETLLSYMTTGAVVKPYSVYVRRSLFILPDNPMPMRYQDNRVGYFYTNKDKFTTDEDRIDQRSYINRWRLEPKEEERDLYFKGELVEPQKPIVFYVDTAFPEKWRHTIREGIEIWNRAFEKAGFKNAVRAYDYPQDDPQFDPDDMRYNCFRYVVTATQNAMGPSYTDPRTGEILAADVIWYHNIVSLLHNWRFVQTAAVDKRVRKVVFDDEVMQESMKYAASHEIGHTLGLMHNMGASYSFPVERLRDAAFTQKYGTTPSIMDYARNNYVAQPGDMEKGVKLTPPDLGVYDIYAINWGYRLIKDAKTPAEEKATLDRWIAEKAADPMYEFGAQQVFSTVDPTDQTEDLGNDHIKASNYGISNLKILVKNFDSWMMEKGERYDNIDDLYREIGKQYTRYVRHVVPYIGGIRYEEIRQGDNKKTAKNYIGKQKQKEAMKWLLNEVRTCDSWLLPKDLMGKIEIDLNTNQKLRSQIVAALLNGSALYRIKEGGEINPAANYKLDDYLEDLTTLLFIAPSGGVLGDAEQELESAAIAQMISSSGLKGSASAGSASPTKVNDSFCGFDTQFARFNLGVSTLSKSQMGAIMTGRLQKVLQKYRSYRTFAKGSTRDFYDYQILLIEKVLSNK
ncbi:MAG: zinc-dependent metalloprotease [Prevotella sp.]|nr:zinc-dependent metalloprotease [Prevotella sp.]